MLNKNIYVISTTKRAKKNEYKLGKHKGNSNELLSRYRTYFVNPVIYYFHPVENYEIIEKKILKKLTEHRIKNNNDNDSEWICLELNKILQITTTIILEYGSFVQELDEKNKKNVIKKNVIEKNVIEKNIVEKNEKLSNEVLEIYKCGKFYKCDKCRYKTTVKTNFNRHLQRKNKCGKKNEENICVCGKKFSRKDNLKRHQNTCEEYE